MESSWDSIILSSFFFSFFHSEILVFDSISSFPLKYMYSLLWWLLLPLFFLLFLSKKDRKSFSVCFCYFRLLYFCNLTSLSFVLSISWQTCYSFTFCCLLTCIQGRQWKREEDEKRAWFLLTLLFLLFPLHLFPFHWLLLKDFVIHQILLLPQEDGERMSWGRETRDERRRNLREMFKRKMRGKESEKRAWIRTKERISSLFSCSSSIPVISWSPVKMSVTHSSCLFHCFFPSVCWRKKEREREKRDRPKESCLFLCFHVLMFLQVCLLLSSFGLIIFPFVSSPPPFLLASHPFLHTSLTVSSFRLWFSCILGVFLFSLWFSIFDSFCRFFLSHTPLFLSFLSIPSLVDAVSVCLSYPSGFFIFTLEADVTKRLVTQKIDPLMKSWKDLRKWIQFLFLQLNIYWLIQDPLRKKSVMKEQYFFMH